jgi:hypothetical protein
VKSMQEVAGCGCGCIDRGGLRKSNFSGEPRDGVGDEFSRSFPNSNGVAAIVMWGRAKIPTINSMRRPSFVDCWFSCTRTRVPGGVRGVQLKSKAP